MDDSIQFISCSRGTALASVSSPEIIDIDDEDDYELEDGEIEVIEINSNKNTPSSSDKKKSKKRRSSKSFSNNKSNNSKGLRSSLTGRPVFSPTDEVLLVQDKDDGDSSNKDNNDDYDPVADLQFVVNQDTSTKTQEEDFGDLSIIEIIQPKHSKKNPGNDYKPLFLKSPRGAAAAGSRPSPLQKAARRKALLDRLAQKRFLRKQRARARKQLNRGILMPGHFNIRNMTRKESLIQQSLRRLCDSTTTRPAQSAIKTPQKVQLSFEHLSKRNNKTTRKSLKRLTSTGNFSSRINNNINLPPDNAKKGRQGTPKNRNRKGQKGGRGESECFRIDRSNQENIVSSTSRFGNWDEPKSTTSLSSSAAGTTATGLVPNSRNNGGGGGGGGNWWSNTARPPNYNTDYNTPVLRNSDDLHSSTNPFFISKYDSTWKKYGHGAGAGSTRSNNINDVDERKLIQGMDMSKPPPVPRDFELASARFTVPPQPSVTFNNNNNNFHPSGAFTNNLNLNTNVNVNSNNSNNNISNQPNKSSAGASSSGAATYNPMSLLSQAKENNTTGNGNGNNDGGGSSSGSNNVQSSATTNDKAPLVLSKFGENCYAPNLLRRPGTLRPIVIDGSNVAMAHGNNTVFSCMGIKLCVDYFKARGHQTILAWISHFRGRKFKTTDPEILEQLEKEGIVKVAPGRTVDGVKISTYDDRFIVQSAAQLGGVIVSNDNYRDLYSQEPTWRETIHKRILQYCWITPEMIMFPNDPLGRDPASAHRQITLDEFLRF